MLHALPETMPVRSLRRVLTTYAVVSCTYPGRIGLYEEQAMCIVDSSGCPVWQTNSFQMMVRLRMLRGYH